MYDVIVVGARCAGSSTAMLLARRGSRVLLVDRATFPSDIMSTHWIHQPGLAFLRRWGLLDRVRATGCPSIPTATFDVGPFALSGTAPAADGVADALAPRRYLLDKILADAAVEAGAELRQGFTMTDLVLEDGRVQGIRGREHGGSTVTERARLVIGADGMHSKVTRLVSAAEHHAKPPQNCVYYTYWSGVETGLELYNRPGRGVALIPTNDGLTCVLVGWRHAEAKEFRRDVEGSYLTTLEIAGDVAERVRAGRREERFVGTLGLPNFYRKPYGPGWALVGDAGYHKDPITAQGITDAFRDAESLTAAVDDWIGGRQAWHDALAGYERGRDEATMPMYEFTCGLAALDPPPPEMGSSFRLSSATSRRSIGSSGSWPEPWPYPSSSPPTAWAASWPRPEPL